MDYLILYPALLIVAVILFYVLGKRNGTEKEVIKTVIHYNDEQVSIYSEETEEEFYLRCHNFIRPLLTEVNHVGHTTDDYKSTIVILVDSDEVSYQISIDLIYSSNLKHISFSTKLNAHAVPNNRLAQVSELSNRLNSAYCLNTYSLNYVTRAIETKIIYYVGNQSLLAENFKHYYREICHSIFANRAYKQVIEGNEEPALVANEFVATYYKF